jgi:hypothetical protein
MKAKSKVQMLKAKVHRPEAKVQRPKSKVQSRTDRRPAAVERLASFLSVWLILALLATGCAGPRPLKGGKAVTTHKPAGVIEQTVVQGENVFQATKQDQERRPYQTSAPKHELDAALLPGGSGKYRLVCAGLVMQT